MNNGVLKSYEEYKKTYFPKTNRNFDTDNEIDIATQLAAKAVKKHSRKIKKINCGDSSQKSCKK